MDDAKSAEAEKKADIKPQASRDTQAAFDFLDIELSLEQMLKAGVHFGHNKARWNPKTKPYIFTVRNNISIINLEKTLESLKRALEFAAGVVKNGGKILLVGTKPQAKKLVEQLAKSVDMPYVSERWLGGTFTNFSEIRKRLKYLNDQEARLARGDLEKYTKYEQLQFKKEIARMNEKMGGIKKMDNLPQAILAADMKEDYLAVKEARAAKIPVIAICDTNVDPDLAGYPIPGNDDALSSLRYLLGAVAKAIAEAKTETRVQADQDKKIPAQKKDNRKTL